MLHPADAGIAQPGSAWDVIPTDVGRIGVILGGDVFHLEVGRLLAYQAGRGDACRLHGFGDVQQSAGMLARMQDNQLFAACSFLVGRNVFVRGEQPGYGQIGHFRAAGIDAAATALVEMGDLIAKASSAEWIRSAQAVVGVIRHAGAAHA